MKLAGIGFCALLLAALVLLPFAQADSLEFTNPNAKWARVCDPLVFKARLANDGSALKHYSVSVNSLEEPVFSSAWLSHVAVPAHSFVDFEIRTSVSCDAVEGDRAFVLAAEDVYGNSLEANGFVFVQARGLVDVEVSPLRASGVLCEGNYNAFRVTVRNSGTQNERVRLQATGSIEPVLSSKEVVLAPGETKEAVMRIAIPWNYSDSQVFYSINAVGASNEDFAEGVAEVARCGGLQISLPSRVEARVNELTRAQFTLLNAGDTTDAATLSLDCPYFVSLNGYALSLLPNEVTGEAALQIRPSDEHAGRSFECVVNLYSQRNRLYYTASTNIDVLFSGTPVPPAAPVLNATEEFEQPASIAEVIIGASRSMDGEVSGVRKIDIAKQFVGAFVDRVSSMKTGFRVYGSQYDETDVRACVDTRLILPIRAVDSAEVKEAISEIEPNGRTPLTYALSQAVYDFDSNDERKLLVVVSDGLESCGLDPCAVANELKAKKIRVFAVGFDIDERGRDELRCLAKETDGQYVDASNYRELIDVVDLLFVKKVVVDSVQPVLLGQTVLEDGNDFRRVRIDFKAENKLDSTQVRPSIEGLPANSTVYFEPLFFYLNAGTMRNFSAFVQVPKGSDYYDATLKLKTTRGEFTLPLSINAREPFDLVLTGFLVTAAPWALGLVALAVLAIIVAAAWVYFKRSGLRPKNAVLTPRT
ncbi:TPA: VWA domain-containing protein [Candidatus Micrarchaeota archaeon]|nr:VWA domain-containing protein [Candidatus Micrarchaeota archaeon]